MIRIKEVYYKNLLENLRFFLDYSWAWFVSLNSKSRSAWGWGRVEDLWDSNLILVQLLGFSRWSEVKIKITWLSILLVKSLYSSSCGPRWEA